MTKISVLVPFGASPDAAGKHRAEVWRWCSRRWDDMRNRGLVDEIIIGVDPLFGRVDFERPYATYPLDAKVPGAHPFSVSRALNDAAKHAHGEHFLLFGADHVPDPKAIEWAAHQLRGYSFARIYERVAYATEATTRLILHGTEMPLDAADWREVSAPCPGVLGVRRDAFERAGGLDERYEDWGYEDQAFLDTLARTHQNGSRGTMGPSGYVLRELWHDPSRRDLDGRNRALYEGRQP
jgi:glycosyl transferase family 7 (putative galactosyltransferase)